MGSIVNAINRIVEALKSVFINRDFVHGQIHLGEHYEAHVESGVATVAGKNLAFRVPAGKELHMVVDWKASDRAHINIKKGATWTTNTGTVVPAVNNNFRTDKTSIIEEDKTDTPNWTAGGILADVTGVAGGTEKHVDYAYNTKLGGGNTSLPRHEWILSPDTYVIELDKDAGSNIYMGIVLHWYEQDLAKDKL